MQADRAEQEHGPQNLTISGGQIMKYKKQKVIFRNMANRDDLAVIEEDDESVCVETDMDEQDKRYAVRIAYAGHMSEQLGELCVTQDKIYEGDLSRMYSFRVRPFCFFYELRKIGDHDFHELNFAGHHLPFMIK